MNLIRFGIKTLHGSTRGFSGRFSAIWGAVRAREIAANVATDQASPQSCRARSLPIRKAEGEQSMRLILGMILGTALTVGGAYISDATISRSPEARPMVNWDVVSKNFDGWSE